MFLPADYTSVYHDQQNDSGNDPVNTKDLKAINFEKINKEPDG